MNLRKQEAKLKLAEKDLNAAMELFKEKEIEVVRCQEEYNDAMLQKEVC